MDVKSIKGNRKIVVVIKNDEPDFKTKISDKIEIGIPIINAYKEVINAYAIYASSRILI